ADNTGAVVNHIVYDSFGNILSETAPAVDHIFGFTGREHDEETGMRYHRARYFDGHRWISEDPIGFEAGDANLSRYVSNSPAIFVDPSGLTTKSKVPLGPVSGPLKRYADNRDNPAVLRIGAATICGPAALIDTVPRAI